MKKVLTKVHLINGEFGDVKDACDHVIRRNRLELGEELFRELTENKCSVFIGVFSETERDEERSIICRDKPNRIHTAQMHVRSIDELLPAMVHLYAACTVAGMKAGLHKEPGKVQSVKLPAWLIPAQIILDQLRPAVRGYLRLIGQQRRLNPDEEYLWRATRMDEEQADTKPK